MPSIYEIRFAEEFSAALAGIWSDRVLVRIKKLLTLLAANPEMGSPNIRASLIAQYGEGLHKVSLSNFIIVYRFDGYTVDVLALVYGPSIV